MSPHRYRPSPGGVSPVKRVGGMGIDYVEVVLLLLPAITIVMIGVWDYISTLYGVVYGGGYELNPSARALLEKGAFDELIRIKGVHILLNIILYVAGIMLYFGGKVKDVPAAKYLGLFFLVLFFVSYFIGLVVITLNILGLSQTIITLVSR